MKLIKYDTLILIVIFAMIWTFSCVHGWYPPIEPPPVIEELVIDSCELQDIGSPPQQCITVADVTRDIAFMGTISWRGSSQTWIDNFAVVDSSHIKILIDIVGENMGYDSVRWIDKSIINGSMIHLDFTICFIDPIGVFDLGSSDGIYFDFPLSGVRPLNDRILVRKDNVGSIYPPDESTSDEMIQLIQPAWQIVGLFGVDLDSTELIPIWDHLLFGCKCCAKIDIRGLDISQDYLDQFIYQQHTVMQ